MPARIHHGVLSQAQIRETERGSTADCENVERLVAEIDSPRRGVDTRQQRRPSRGTISRCA